MLLFGGDNMNLIIKILVSLVAIEHLYILWIEMFAWTTKGVSTFKSLPKELFQQTKVLAANQGLYNGFLAAGLIWSLLICDSIWSENIDTFFLGCVIVAAVYGAITASKSIFLKQGMPALITLVLLFIY
jgi:putative membrane protein